MAIIEKLPVRAEGIQAFTSRIRPWAEADDDKPVFMLNLVRCSPIIFMPRSARGCNHGSECGYTLFERKSSLRALQRLVLRTPETPSVAVPKQGSSNRCRAKFCQ